MANANTVFGARQTGSLISASTNERVQTFTVPATDATALFVGDFVKLTGTAAVGPDGHYHPVVTQAATNETLIGFVVGFEADPDNLNKIYRTASTLRNVRVQTDPYVILEIQAQGTLAAADIGLNADIIVGAGDPNTGISGMELDLSTKNTASRQLRILDIVPREDNEFGQYSKVLCLINEHRYKTISGV